MKWTSTIINRWDGFVVSEMMQMLGGDADEFDALVMLNVLEGRHGRITSTDGLREVVDLYDSDEWYDLLNEVFGGKA